MLNVASGLRALVESGLYQVEVDVLIEAVISEEETALRTYRNYLGENWIANLNFSVSVDQTIASGTVVLAREHQDVSLAPLMEESPANLFGAGVYAPAIDGGREIEIRLAVLPHIQTHNVVAPGAAAGATTVPTTPLPFAADRGTQILIGTNKPAFLTEPASKGATSLSVTPLPLSVAAGNLIQVYGALPDSAYNPGVTIYGLGNWIPIFQGITDKPDWGGKKNEVSITFRNRLAVLADAQILDAFKVGLPGVKTPVEDVAQQVINHEVPGSFTVYTHPEPPGFEITYGDVQPQLVWEALSAFTTQYGGRVQHKQRNGYGDFDLCLVLPDRGNTTPQYTIAPTQYIDLPSIDLDRAQVRTIVRIAYVDEASGTLQYLQTPAPGTEADDPLVRKYGPQKMQLAFKAFENINTEEEARILLDRTYSDVSTPPLPQEIECFAIPWVELDDRILLPANGVHYDTDQVGAVIAISWNFARRGAARMTIRTADKAKGAFHNYRSLDAQIYGFNASQREPTPTLPLPALNNFGPTKKTAEGVTVSWEPSTAPPVAQVWVYELEVAVPFVTAPVPAEDAARTAVITSGNEYFIAYPPKGFEKFCYFVPVTSVGTLGVAQVSHVFPVEGFPTISLVSQSQGSTSAFADAVLRVDDPQGFGGTLHLWTAKASPLDASVDDPPAIVTVVATPADIGPFEPAQDATFPLDDFKVHAARGKRIFAKFTNVEGTESAVHQFNIHGYTNTIEPGDGLAPGSISTEDLFDPSVKPPLAVSELPPASEGPDKPLVYLIDDEIRRLYRFIPALNAYTPATDGQDLTPSSVTANKIIVGTLAALSVDTGALSAGIMLNAASGATKAIRLNAAYAMPLTVDAFLDLSAEGADPFIEHPALTLEAGGNASFSGNLSAAGGTFAGALSAASGLFLGTVTVGDNNENAIELLNDVGNVVGVLTSETDGATLANGTESSGFAVMTDGRARVFGSLGIEMGGQNFSPMVERGDSGALLAIQWNAGNVQSCVLTDDPALSLAGGKSGAMLTLVVRQDATGGRTISWPSGVLWPSSTVVQPTSTAGTVTVYHFLSIGSDKYLATATVDYTVPGSGPTGAPSALSGVGSRYCSGRHANYRVTLTWTNGDAASETRIFRDGGTAGTAPAGATSAEVLTTSGTHTYYVAHASSGILSAPSGTVSVSLAAIDCSPSLVFP